MRKADDVAKSRTLDRAIGEVMTTLRNASSPLVPEALEIVERIEAEIAARQPALDEPGTTKTPHVERSTPGSTP